MEKPKEEKQGMIQFTLPMQQKANYVKAAHAEGKKLVPWMLEHLDEAALREAKTIGAKGLSAS